MKPEGGLSAYFTSFLVGTVNLLFVALYVWAVQLGPHVEPSADIKKFLASLLPFALPLGALVPILAIVIGHFIDGLGHIVVDESLLRITRAKYVGESRRKLLAAALPQLDGDNFDAVLEAVFLAQAPGHLLAHHQNQWSYYELYRNLVLTAFVQTLLGPFFLWGILSWAGIVIWLVISVLLLIIGRLTLPGVLTYYHQVESAFVLGWLLGKETSSCSEGETTSRLISVSPEMDAEPSAAPDADRALQARSVPVSS